MDADFQPASIRRNKRSYPAVRVSLPDPDGGSPLVHRLYSDFRGFERGSDARKEAKAMIDDGRFDLDECAFRTRQYWGLA